MTKRQPKKIKQHHVPQVYLRRWATDGQLWCLRGDKVFLTNPLNIAQERYFYAVEHVEIDDILPFAMMIRDATDADLKAGLNEWLQSYWDVSQLRDGIVGREDELPELAAMIDDLHQHKLEDELAILDGFCRPSSS